MAVYGCVLSLRMFLRRVERGGGIAAYFLVACSPVALMF